VEDGAGLGAGTALHLSFDGPWEVGTVIASQNRIRTYRVKIFGVDQEAVHVEKGSSNWWWVTFAVSKLSLCRLRGRIVLCGAHRDVVFGVHYVIECTRSI
jgi:hypothetical protein